MKLWFPFKVSALTALGLVTFSLLGCGNIDPGKPPVGGGNAGEGASAGEGSGGNATAGENMGATGGQPEGGGAGAPPIGPTQPLLPWAVGNTWTYEVTQDGLVSEKVTTIGDEEEVGGVGPNAAKLAYHVSTVKGTNGNDHTESWQAPSEDNPDRIVRYREQSFGAVTGELELEEHWEPEKLHIDGSAERSVTGANWLEVYDETKLAVGLEPFTHELRERWTVIADDETLTVPAGTFEHVIHFRKAGSSNTAKEYWYVRGVGKLRETGTQTEELVDYSVEETAP